MKKKQLNINKELMDAGQLAANAIYHKPNPVRIKEITTKVRKVHNLLNYIADQHSKNETVSNNQISKWGFGPIRIFKQILQEFGVIQQNSTKDSRKLTYRPTLLTADVSAIYSAQLCIEAYWFKVQFDEGLVQLKPTSKSTTRIEFKLAKTSYDVTTTKKTQKRFCPQCQTFLGSCLFGKLSLICSKCAEEGPKDADRVKREKEKANKPEPVYSMPYTHKISKIGSGKK